MDKTYSDVGYKVGELIDMVVEIAGREQDAVGRVYMVGIVEGVEVVGRIEVAEDIVSADVGRKVAEGCGRARQRGVYLAKVGAGRVEGKLTGKEKVAGRVEAL